MQVYCLHFSIRLVIIFQQINSLSPLLANYIMAMGRMLQVTAWWWYHFCWCQDDDIAEYAADEVHWSGTAGKLNSTVKHAGAVYALMPLSANFQTGDPRTNRPGRRPRRRLKNKQTQPSILVEGPVRPSSRKTNPRKLWKAQSESRQQIVAGQLVRGQQDHKTYRCWR